MKARPSSYPVIKSLTDKFTFGKYKGASVQSIVELHPSYFVWLVENDVIDLQDDELYWMAQLNEEDEQENQHPYFSMRMEDFLRGDDD